MITARETPENKRKTKRRKTMTNTNNTIRKKTAGKFKRTIASVLAAVMMMTMAASFSVFADTQAVTTVNNWLANIKLVPDNFDSVFNSCYRV